MLFTVSDIVWGVVAPASVAMMILVTLPRIVRTFDHHRSAPPIALWLGFELAYWSLPLGPVAPASHWQWLPYIVTAATIVGLVSQVFGRKLWQRGLAFLVCAAAGGYLLTPTWNDLQPSRSVYIIFWAILVTAISLGIRIPFRTSPEQRQTTYSVAIVLFATFSAAAVLLLLADSLRFSQMALALAGASAGILAAVVLRLSRFSFELTVYPTVVSLCGLMMVGRMNSFSAVPWISYLLLPLAPLGMWVVRRSSVQAWTGWRQAAALVTVPLVICAAAIGMAAGAVWHGE